MNFNDNLRSYFGAPLLDLDLLNLHIGTQHVAAVYVGWSEIAPGVFEGTCPAPTGFFGDGDITHGDLLSTYTNAAFSEVSVSDYEGNGIVRIESIRATDGAEVPVGSIRILLVVPSAP